MAVCSGWSTLKGRGRKSNEAEEMGSRRMGHSSSLGVLRIAVMDFFDGCRWRHMLWNVLHVEDSM